MVVLKNIKNAILKKIVELTKKYFQTRNPDARYQIQLMINSYKLEMSERQIKARMNNTGNKDLDKLVDIS